MAQEAIGRGQPPRVPAKRILPRRSRWREMRRSLLAAKSQFDVLRQDKFGLAGMIILSFFILMALFAPWVAPHDPMETLMRADGTMPEWTRPP